ncbi:MAG: putative glycoside hydrolase [Candidatus Kapaibacteriales bacterium]
MNRLQLLIVSLIFIFTLTKIFCIPIEFSSRGARPYLVNYSAIKNNNFLRKIALNRFHLLDEASTKELTYFRSVATNFLILKYKDLIALHRYYPEANTVNLSETAFLHTTDPANLTISFDSSWVFEFTQDERFKIFDQDHKLKYKLYYSSDSINFLSYADSIYTSTKFKVNLPKSARYVKLNTIVDDTLELDYSFVLPLRNEPNSLLIIPVEKKVRNSGNIDSIFIHLRLLNNILPDSLKLFIDLNRDNYFSSTQEIVTTKSVLVENHYKFTTSNITYKGGYEFFVLLYYKGQSYRFPKEGYWITNPNNRIMSPEYGFFVMNVGDSNWRKVYVNELQKALNLGFNGIFIDDCVTFLGNWVADAMPPIGYSREKWINDIIDFLWFVRNKFTNAQIFFNGLTDSLSLYLLPAVDGAMTEGFPTRTWGSYFVSTPHWQNYCNIALSCLQIYKKKWLALGKLLNQQPKGRIYTLGTYSLVFDSLSYYATATSYQDFAHYPEFDIPFGTPLASAKVSIEELKKFDINNKPYYSREFENVIIYVNPSNADTIWLPELDGKQIIEIDTNKTIDGGKLRTGISNEFLLPNEAKIVLKGLPNITTILTSPIIRNPKCIIEQVNEDSVRLTISVEVADSSSHKFFSNPEMPLYIVADLSTSSPINEMILLNDGSPASSTFSEYSNSLIVPSFPNIRNLSIPITAYSTTGLFSVGYAEIETKNIDTSNLLNNFSFEFDLDGDGIPDFWKPYMKGFSLDTTNAYHGSRCVVMKNLTKDDTSGIYSVININQSEPKKIKISGYSKADSVDGRKDNNYSIYVDFFYNDDQPLYGQTAQFSVGTHDWEYSEKIVIPEKPIKKAIVYCLFRYHTGKAWFDKIRVEEYKEISTSGEHLPEQSSIQIVDNHIESGEIQIFSPNAGLYKIQLFNLLGELIESNEVWLDQGISKINTFQFFQSVKGIHILRINNHIHTTNKVVFFY